MSEKLRALLKKRNMKQRELAKRVKVSPSMVNKIINGKATPSIKLLERIAHELDVSIKDLL